MGPRRNPVFKIIRCTRQVKVCSNSTSLHTPGALTYFALVQLVHNLCDRFNSYVLAFTESTAATLVQYVYQQSNVKRAVGTKGHRTDYLVDSLCVSMSNVV